MTLLEQEIIEKLRQLEPVQQEQVLALVRNLAHPRGVTGASLLKFAGQIAQDDLARMEEALKDCETIDYDTW